MRSTREYNSRVMRNKWLKIKTKLSKGMNQLPFLVRGLRLVWSAAPGWTYTWLALLALQGVLPVALVYLTRYLVDAMVVVIREPTVETLMPALLGILGMAVVMVLTELLRGLTTMVRTAQSERMMDHVSAMIHQKAVEIDLSYYDMPDYYNQLHRARTGTAYRSLALLEGLGTILQNGITLISMVFVLAPYGLWLPLALLISTLPAFGVVLRHRIAYHRWYVKNTERERKANYYDWMLTQRESAMEMRLFRLSDPFRQIFRQIRGELREERLQLMKNQSLSELVASLGALLVTGLSMAWMIWQTVLGVYTLGDVALFYQAFNQGQSLMRSLMQNVGEIYSHSFFLADLFEFLELEPKVRDPELPQPVPETICDGLRFEAVNFSYPGVERQALQQFNLHIPAGKIVAIVGSNGAGKSTLIKLLCRFYDPDAGRITLDGVDLKAFRQDDLRSRITVLFQEPVHYNARARENIAMGRIDLPPQPGEVEQAAAMAGADRPIERLPRGYDTLLGKWFKDGTDLSVGEWQRVALARAFLRQAPLVLLDEPTSAMDPWAEADWLERFRELAAGRTAVLVTHRFTTAAYADIIHVMDEGQIVESGSHHELVQAGGRYAVSWNEQMRRWMAFS